MAKSKAGRRKKAARPAGKSRSRPAASAARRKARRASSARPKSTGRRAKSAAARPKAVKAKAALKRPTKKKAAARRPGRPKPPQLDRARRTLEDIVPTPPSSLNMNRRGSAARSGRAEMNENLLQHRNMTPAIAGGDVDVDLQDAYFTGDEAPGGDNPTPDQDVVDDIGKALGVQYQDDEELKSADKVTDRDKHRWELDPASAEDYKDRK